MRALLFLGVLCAASVAHADSFFSYNSRGTVTTGSVWPGGGFSYDSRGNVSSWRQPVFYPQPVFVPIYQPVYRPMVPAFRRW